ncbi:hypothetical protein OHW50_00265 [Acinetobacter baumannii]|nr:hypothetical protein [Acinetobacter baumannii]
MMIVAFSLAACGPQPGSPNEQPLKEEKLTGIDLVRMNREKYAKDIREATKECLVSVRSNPQVQNYNDDNEIVKSCTEYALKLYSAYWSEWNGAV